MSRPPTSRSLRTDQVVLDDQGCPADQVVLDDQGCPADQGCPEANPLPGGRAVVSVPHGTRLPRVLAAIRGSSPPAMHAARERQHSLTKPRGSLGVLEDISVQLAGLAGRCPPPMPDPAAVAVFAADHGVTARGVSLWPQEVTLRMVANFLASGAAVNAFARQAGAHVVVVDVGLAGDLPEDARTTSARLVRRRVRNGTGDMTVEPAMSRAEALRAIDVGIEVAEDLVASGYRCLVTGEKGIGNTTASAVLVTTFTGADPDTATGCGAGLDEAARRRKVDVVRAAVERHRPDPTDPVGVLAAVGGLEHAALTGFVLAAAAHRVPVILDGVIAGSSALVATALAPQCLAACVAGHRSVEPGHALAMGHLGLRPLLDLDLRLGEATGALLALPVVQTAVRALREMATFEDAGITRRQR